MKKRKLSAFAIIFAFMAFGPFSLAVAGGNTFPLMATKEHPGASGTAVIGNDRISIEAKGLKPDSAYTVWFVNMKPKKHEAGAGTPPYMFKTNAYGAGTYSASLHKSPFGKWQMVMIVLHPNGNPMDMKNMVGALAADLK